MPDYALCLSIKANKSNCGKIIARITALQEKLKNPLLMLCECLHLENRNF